MRILKLHLLIGIQLFTILSCSLQKSSNTDNIFISWEVISNTSAEQPKSKCVFIIENKGKNEFVGNWQLYFSQTPRKVFESPTNTHGIIEHLSGDWYRLVPQNTISIKPYEQIKIYYETEYWFIKESDAPSGLYFVFTDNRGEESISSVQNYTILPFNRPEQILRHKNDLTPLPTAEEAYKANKELKLVTKNNLLKVIPSPKFISVGENSAIFKDSLTIFYDNDNLLHEADYLKEQINNLLGWTVLLQEGIKSKSNSILLSINHSVERSNEFYNLQIINRNFVTIQGNSRAGVFYGIQSLLALLPIDNILEKSSAIELPVIQIEDSPRFAYRGVHVDVVRNFMSKETILKTIDILAFYKINTLHLHLTDDEGWRLEIKTLPELTQVGGQRAHVPKDANALHPAYGSGAHKYGGFYTRKEYVEILQYAHKKHIKVIPEINMPGHARAAIKAMEARYSYFMEKGDTSLANEFRLIDPLDESEYLSAQFYSDNVVNVALESTYRFLEVVIDEIVEMHREAATPLEILHVGGDEVPIGAWIKSPAVNRLLMQNPNKLQPDNLHSYFTERALDIFQKHELRMGGWEEIALHNNNDHVVNPRFANGKVIPYVWNSLWGAQDLAYRLANRGYPVVMCHVTNFYFDLAYSNHPKEPGLYWGGFVNTKSAWLYNPFNIFQTLDKDNFGRHVDIDVEYINMERLNASAQKNILGLQAQLWSETIMNPEMLEYSLLPKLIGFAETAWGKERRWEKTLNINQHKKEVEEDWNIFANSLAQRELPRLSMLFGGFNYRIPTPGAIIENNVLHANLEFPGLKIRYTTDGSEPNEKSHLYEVPIEVNAGLVKIRSFDKAGKSSRTIEIITDGSKTLF
jgi:hexosaminidase